MAFWLRSISGSDGKRLSTMWETWVRSLVREVLWRRKWQPTPVLLPRKPHGRRSLVSVGLRRVEHDWATSLFFLSFFMILWILAIWSLVPLPFLASGRTSGSSWFTYCWSLAWRLLSITLLACGISAIVHWFDHSLALSFFGIGMKTDFFQSYGHCCVFQIC